MLKHRLTNVLTAFLWLVITRDIQEHGMSHPEFLLESDQWDAVLCALVVDLDFDGQKEVLIGTYGQVRGGRGLLGAVPENDFTYQQFYLFCF
jgi:hypothetical protein